jgi:hypothetical protein
MKALIVTAAVYGLYLMFSKPRQPEPRAYTLFDYHQPKFMGHPPWWVERNDHAVPRK